mgnify:CR=1 FL=1
MSSTPAPNCAPGRLESRAACYLQAWESAGSPWPRRRTGIFPENQASVRLQEACGFRVVGVRERLGRLQGRWRDVLLMERRSPVIT